MAYVRPLVQVYQEYESFSGTAQSTVLNPCIIGPCNQFMDETKNTEEDLFRSFFGICTETGIDEASVPNKLADALLDADSVRLRFTEPFVDMGGSDIVVTDIDNNEIEFASGTYPAGIKAGDYLSIYDDGEIAAERFLVTEVDDTAYIVTLNKVVQGVTVIEATAKWLRQLPEFTITGEDTAVTVSATEATVTIGAVSRDVDDVSKTIVHAVVNCGYQALRRDVDTLQTADNLDLIEELLGAAVPENPLAFGAMVALANTNGTIYFIGVDSDDLAGYTAAKDLLENAEDVYSVVPLTRDEGVLAMFKVHAETSSLPSVGKWRIAFGNSELPTVIEDITGTCKVQENQAEDLVVIYSDGSTFIADAVNEGDTLLLTIDNGSVTEHTISAIVSEDMLLVSDPITGVTADTVDYDFTVSQQADRTAQAAAISRTSESYGSPRFYHVWPDICVIDGKEQPGYYLCCAIAGMVSGLPSQQGLTRISIAGISAVKNSSDYFNTTQLDKIADGGTMILMQLSSTSPPYIRHQLSTDMSVYEFRELSFVKNFDFVSYICKDVLDGFIGRYNVTMSTLGALETVLSAVLESLKLSSVARIGSPVIDYKINSVTQLEDQKDRVEIYVDVEFPYALNMVGLHLVSSDL